MNDMLNTPLEILSYDDPETGFDVYIRPIENSKLFEIYATNNWYTLRVSTDFVNQLLPLLRVNDHISIEALFHLFGDNFRQNVMSPFRFYPKLGFITENYGEFFIQYEPLAHQEFLTYQKEYLIGDVEVQISRSSCLFFLLNIEAAGNFINDHEPDRILTIKLKGTSLESFEDYLYSALYHLSQLLPSESGDLPRIAKILSVEGLNYEDKSNLDIEPNGDIASKSFPKPSNLTSLRFFYQADLLPTTDLLLELEAILYYYKVLEHFFEIAWRDRLTKLISQANGNINTFVKLVNREAKPHQPKMSDLVSQANGDINVLLDLVAKERPPGTTPLTGEKGRRT